MWSLVRHLFTDTRGQELTEYAYLCSFLVIAAMVGIVALGAALDFNFRGLSSAVAGVPSSGGSGGGSASGGGSPGGDGAANPGAPSNGGGSGAGDAAGGSGGSGSGGSGGSGGEDDGGDGTVRGNPEP